MIEKIPEHKDFAPTDLRDKLNEVIEAVNVQHHSIQTLNTICKKLEYLANPLQGAP